MDVQMDRDLEPPALLHELGVPRIDVLTGLAAKVRDHLLTCRHSCPQRLQALSLATLTRAERPEPACGDRGYGTGH